MAGRGPAPKHEGQRRRQNAPERGEWVDLGPLEVPVLPDLEKLHPRAQALWDAWRDDPVTATFGPAEIAAAVELAHLTDEFAGGGDPDLKYQRVTPSELRLRMDGLGFTLKGKRDLRLRVASADEPELVAQPSAEVRSLRAV